MHKFVRRGLLIFVTALLGPVVSVYGQSQEGDVVVPSIPLNRVPSFSQQEVFKTPPTLKLIPHSANAHTGNVWVRMSDDGLHIWGKVDAPEEGFRWPEQKSEMLSSDHVEIWLATAPDVPMPPIGWGNQFGATELASAKDCAEQTDDLTSDRAGPDHCERWFNQQQSYRALLRRLFVRQWIAAATPDFGNHIYEAFASSAYANIKANFFSDSVQTAEPDTQEGVKVEFARLSVPQPDPATHRYRQTGYTFYAVIPYSAYPPVDRLKLSDLYLMVDVFSAAEAGHKTGEYSSTSARRQWGKPETFNHVRLAAPREFSLTPCEYPLQQEDIYDAPHSAWFFPTTDGSPLRATFALINDAAGYLYEAGGVSPQVREARYDWKTLSNGSTVCGPQLAWKHGPVIRHSGATLDWERFDTLSLPGGWTLVRSGPTPGTLSKFGSGQCGACLTMNFEINAISPLGEITEALNFDQSLSGQGDDPSGADLTIAPDWKKITLFLAFPSGSEQGGESGWTASTFCLEGHRYKPCDYGKNVKPPDPPHFKELQPQD